MNTATDWNSMPIAGRHMDPDAPDPSEIREYRELAYLDDWINGELVEVFGNELYTTPIDRLLDGDGIERLAVMLDHMRSKRDEALLSATKLFLEKLEQAIRKDAA